jgi:hypothetical protein
MLALFVDEFVTHTSMWMASEFADVGLVAPRKSVYIEVRDNWQVPMNNSSRSQFVGAGLVALRGPEDISLRQKERCRISRDHRLGRRRKTNQIG